MVSVTRSLNLRPKVKRTEILILAFSLKDIVRYWAAPWHKQLDARLPPLMSRVRYLVTPSGFRGRRNRV